MHPVCDIHARITLMISRGPLVNLIKLLHTAALFSPSSKLVPKCNIGVEFPSSFKI